MMLLGLLLLWLLTAFGLWLTSLLVPGIRIRSGTDLLLAALVLGLMNALIRPLLWVLTLPLTVLTFGLFALLVNAFILWLTGRLVPGFEVRDFASALLGALIMALLGVAAMILLQFGMMGTVHWVTIEPGTPPMAF
ncbi:phage holin family protein [Thiohalobacter sp.]|uniref:phage holin family protein n=1 Tax=Thiohalobacter sp. TaxID=2025948 RepID=UPI00262679A0|nr:phage holin family protein [Thiohalobacter sp.]